MKKTILFFSLILVGAFVMFGFQKSTALTTSTNEYNIEKQTISNTTSTFKINAHNIVDDKCGAGKCGGGKAKKAKSTDSKCGAGKCGGDKKESKKDSKCGAGKCGG